MSVCVSVGGGGGAVILWPLKCAKVSQLNLFFFFPSRKLTTMLDSLRSTKMHSALPVPLARPSQLQSNFQQPPPYSSLPDFGTRVDCIGNDECGVSVAEQRCHDSPVTFSTRGECGVPVPGSHLATRAYASRDDGETAASQLSSRDFTVAQRVCVHVKGRRCSATLSTE